MNTRSTCVIDGLLVARLLAAAALGVAGVRELVDDGARRRRRRQRAARGRAAPRHRRRDAAAAGAAAPPPPAAAPRRRRPRRRRAGSRRRRRRRPRRPRHSAAATAAAAGRDADAGRRRSCRRPRRRRIRASASRPAAGMPAQAAWNMRMISTTPPTGQGARRDALGSRVHRQVRDSGQLQRLRDLRHLESREAGADADRICARRRRTTCRSTRTCCSCRRKRPTAAPTAASAACPIRSARLRVRGIRVFDISRHQASEARDERADVPRIAHAHGRDASRATTTTCTSTCRARPACGRPTKCRDARTAASTIRTRRASGSK